VHAGMTIGETSKLRKTRALCLGRPLLQQEGGQQSNMLADSGLAGPESRARCQAGLKPELAWAR